MSPSLGVAGFLRDLVGVKNPKGFSAKAQELAHPLEKKKSRDRHPRRGVILIRSLQPTKPPAAPPSHPSSAPQRRTEGKRCERHFTPLSKLLPITKSRLMGGVCARVCARAHRKRQIACCMCGNTLSARAQPQLHGSEGKESSVRVRRGHVRHSKYQPPSFLT